MLATVNGQRWNMSRGCERWWLSTAAGDQRGCGRQRHKRRGTDAYRKRDCCGLMTAPDKLSKRFIDDQNCWITLVNKYIFCLCLLWLEQLRSAQGVMLLNTHRRLMWHFKTAGTINNSHRGGSCTHPTSQWLTCAWISFLFFDIFWAVQCFCLIPDAHRFTLYSINSSCSAFMKHTFDFQSRCWYFNGRNINVCNSWNHVLIKHFYQWVFEVVPNPLLEAVNAP